MNSQSSDYIDENNRLINLCTQKLQSEPNNQKALLLRLSTYIKINELNLALNDAQKIINIDSNNSTVFFY